MTDVVLGADLRVRGLGGFKRDMGEARKSSQSLKRAIAHTRKAEAEADKMSQRRMRSLRRGAGIATKAVAGLTLGFTALGAASIKSFGDFDLQMARIQTMLPRGASAMDQYGESVLRNAVTFGQSIGETSNAVFQSLSAGISGSKQQMDDYTAVLGQAAAGGFTGMAVAADGLTNTINAFGLSIDDARTVSDAFFAANRLGKTTFEELSRTMGRVAPTMKTLGGSYHELLAVVVAMTKAGVKTSEVMSSLKQVLANIASPTKEAEEQAAKLSIKLGGDGVRAAGGLANFLNLLAVETRDNVDAQTALFGSVESFNTVARLASKTGLRDFNIALQQIEGSAGDTQKAFDDVSNTVGFKLKQIKTGISRAAIEIGFGLTEGLGFDKLNDIPQRVESASRTIRSAARSFADAFSEAFAPVIQAEGMDWDGIAASLGSGAASLVKAFGEIAKGLIALVNSDAFQALVSVIGAAGSTLSFILGGPQATEDKGAVSNIVARITGVGGSALTPTLGARIGGMVGVTGGIGMEGGRYNPFLAEVQIRQQAALAVQKRIDKDRAEYGIAGHAGAVLDPLQEALGGRSVGQVEEEYAAEVKRLRQEAVVSERKYIGGRLEETGRTTAGLEAGEKAAQRMRARQIYEFEQAQEKSKAALADVRPKDQPYWSVTINQNNTTNLKDKSARGGGSFSARGRGPATLNSSFEQNYLLMEGRIIPMGDEFHFGHQISDEPTATLPSAG